MDDYDWYLDNTPVVKPPPGRESNFVNPESISYQLATVIGVMTALMVLFTADLCILAFLFTLALNINVLMMLDKPGGGPDGTHLWDVTLRKWIYHSKLGITNSVLIRTSNTTIKCAFFVFYLRLFGPKDHIRTMVFSGLAVVLTFYVVFVISYLVTLLPRDGDYLSKEFQRRQGEAPAELTTAAAYMSVLTDIYIMMIPMHQVPKLGLSYKRKWGISLIFLTGLVATTAGIINIIFRHNKNILDWKDITWSGQYVLMASHIECNLGMVCLSMPVVLALFVGRITAFGQSLGSWVNLRKAQRHGAGDSASNLSPSDGNESAPETAPEIPTKRTPDPRLRGMRKFIRNLNRSRAQTSELDPNTTVMSTFNDLTSADFSYHHQLKTLHPSQTANIRRRNSENFEKLEKLG